MKKLECVVAFFGISIGRSGLKKINLSPWGCVKNMCREECSEIWVVWWTYILIPVGRGQQLPKMNVVLIFLNVKAATRSVRQ